MKKLLIISLVSSILYGCSNNVKTPDTSGASETVSTPLIDYSLIKTLPHDTSSFTEGLIFHDNQLFESTGSPSDLPQTKSVFGIVDLKTGKIGVKGMLDKSKYFGEGIVFVKNKMYQLTYQNHIGFIYDAKTFKKLGEFHFKNKEGWALTTDGTNIIMSDGTDSLTYLDPNTLKVVKTLVVTENGSETYHLNELEYIKGYIFANIWMTNYIVKIDPATGKITGKLDLTSLCYEAKNINPYSDVMNGIAYDSATGNIFITGKMWPNIYQLKIP